MRCSSKHWEISLWQVANARFIRAKVRWHLINYLQQIQKRAGTGQRKGTSKRKPQLNLSCPRQVRLFGSGRIIHFCVGAHVQSLRDLHVANRQFEMSLSGFRGASFTSDGPLYSSSLTKVRLCWLHSTRPRSKQSPYVDSRHDLEKHVQCCVRFQIDAVAASKTDAFLRSLRSRVRKNLSQPF